MKIENEDHYFCDCGYAVSVLNVLNKKIRLEWRYVDMLKETACQECGHLSAKMIQVEQYICPKCSKDMKEIRIEDEIIEVGDNSGMLQVMGTPYKTPIHSDALAMQPDQIAEHKRLFPNVPVDDLGRPVFTHAKQHQEYLDKCGIKKQTQKIGRGKGKIYSYSGCRCS